MDPSLVQEVDNSNITEDVYGNYGKHYVKLYGTGTIGGVYKEWDYFLETTFFHLNRK
jgi:hypothetical protein